MSAFWLSVISRSQKKEPSGLFSAMRTVIFDFSKIAPLRNFNGLGQVFKSVFDFLGKKSTKIKNKNFGLHLRGKGSDPFLRKTGTVARVNMKIIHKSMTLYHVKPGGFAGSDLVDNVIPLMK